MRTIDEDDKFLLLYDGRGRQVIVESEPTLMQALDAAAAIVCENIEEVFVAQVTHKVRFEPVSKATKLRDVQNV
jgi:hypothetical protein